MVHSDGEQYDCFKLTVFEPVRYAHKIVTPNSKSGSS